MGTATFIASRALITAGGAIASATCAAVSAKAAHDLGEFISDKIEDRQAEKLRDEHEATAVVLHRENA